MLLWPGRIEVGKLADLAILSADLLACDEDKIKDIRADGIYSRLAADKKLRKNLRALLDDLDAAGNRVRRKTHRVRTFVLMLVGVAGAALAFSKSRPWLTKRTETFGSGTSS